MCVVPGMIGIGLMVLVRVVDTPTELPPVPDPPQPIAMRHPTVKMVKNDNVPLDRCVIVIEAISAALSVA